MGEAQLVRAAVREAAIGWQALETKAAAKALGAMDPVDQDALQRLHLMDAGQYEVRLLALEVLLSMSEEQGVVPWLDEAAMWHVPSQKAMME